MPDLQLADPLIEAMQSDASRGGPGDAVALIGHFGNLLIVAGGNHGASQIRTAFMECTRAYAGLRQTLFHLHEADPAAYPEDRHLYLPHSKYCTFVAALSPDEGALSYMALGAYGSTMEGPISADNPTQSQYCVDRIPPAAVKAVCAVMPPLYSQII